MFGIINNVIDTTLDIATEVVSTTVELGSLGTIELDRRTLRGLLNEGLTLIEIAEGTGVALDVLESIMED